jgi:5-formyltetrahydrofolate cyclo-ligase
MDKEELRITYKSLRKKLSQEEVTILSEKITTSFLGFLLQQPKVRHIHIFFSIKRFNEIDTFPLFYELKRLGYNLYTSEVNGHKDALNTLHLGDISGFELSSWGIPKPIGAKLTEPKPIQMVLIPLLAYDEKGNRLGYGKGYYDKFLATLESTVLKVGLSFFPPERQIPADLHDIGLDICVTPDQIHHFV